MVALALPVQPTSFVGRTHELSEIMALFDNPDCRLVTLVGPGGIGKTRLALETGLMLRQRQEMSDSASATNAFVPDDVYFVSLQPLNSPEFILSAIAESVGLQFYAGCQPREQLIDYCRPKTLLLILDNFEHLLAGVDSVADLLANAPNLRILVTSRESLNLREEWLYPVKGMTFPEQAEVADPDSYSAVRLFVQSARRVRPDFSLSAEHQAVLRICKLVEGMPLALEMTAAWLRRLPADEIVQQLEHGLDILESPARNVPARHRSIRVVFEHSWNLLTETEQAAFEKLSVFRGGCRREAAGRIAGATLGILSALVDKSLLYIDADGRYTLHELVRQYAEEKLNATPALNRQTHQDHCTYYMNFLIEREIGMMVHMSLVAVAEITAELKNVRCALDWMLEHDLIERYSDAINCLMLFYQFRCLYDEGEEVSGRVVAELRRNPPGATLGRMLVLQGWFVELRSQDYDRAIAILEEAWQIAQGVRYENFAEPLLRLSDIAVQLGDFERARQLAQQNVEIGSADSDCWPHTFDLAQLGYVSYLLGDYPEAKRLIQEAIRIAEKYEVLSGVADAQNYLGRVELALHTYQDAKQTFVKNLDYSKQGTYLKGVVLALIGAAEATRALGEHQEVRHYLSEALQTALESNQIPYVLDALVVTAEMLVQTDNSERTVELASYVVDHHAAVHLTKSRATRLLAQLESQLSAETMSAAIERTKSGQLEKLVHGLLECELSEVPTVNSVSGMAVSASPLTERELEILRLTADGLTNREIAEQLFLAVGTVKWYLSEIYAKLYVTSRTQAIARARELNFLA